jgi:hypothetical protein
MAMMGHTVYRLCAVTSLLSLMLRYSDAARSVKRNSSSVYGLATVVQRF